MKQWHTILGGQMLDPNKHTDEEQLRFRFVMENIGSGSSPYERFRTARALHLAKVEGFYPEALEWAKRKRAGWVEHLTMAQRRWQLQTRRPCRARHHDSIAIREKYVRCLP